MCVTVYLSGILSDEDPHIVMASAGDYITQEALAAVSIIRNEVPELRIRFVNIASLSALGIEMLIVVYCQKF